MALPETDIRFPAMGCGLRVLVGPPLTASGRGSEEAALRARQLLESFSARLSRFETDSELTVLNDDGRETVEVSPLLASMVDAALWAARSSGGLLDPTLIPELERAGYASTRRGLPSARLADALPDAPVRRPAAAAPERRWESITVDMERLTVTRPPGVRIDSGGIGKGLAADAIAAIFADRERFCVDTAGDLRIGGPDSLADPYNVDIEDPFGGPPILTIRVGQGAVATSGIDSRLWKLEDGSHAHHLIDPSTGWPAWTGVVQATALAPTALEAESLAKQALLSGPTRAARILEPHGGLIVLDDGEAEAVGPVARFATAAGSTRSRTAA